MKRLYSKLKSKLVETKWKYKRFHSNVRVRPGGCLTIGKNVHIKHTNIFVDESSVLHIEDNVLMENIGIFVTNGGNVKIENDCILIKERNSWIPEYICNGGTITFENHVLSKIKRVWCRFGGSLKLESIQI